MGSGWTYRFTSLLFCLHHAAEAAPGLRTGLAPSLAETENTFEDTAEIFPSETASYCKGSPSSCVATGGAPFKVNASGPVLARHGEPYTVGMQMRLQSPLFGKVLRTMWLGVASLHIRDAELGEAIVCCCERAAPAVEAMVGQKATLPTTQDIPGPWTAAVAKAAGQRQQRQAAPQGGREDYKRGCRGAAGRAVAPSLQMLPVPPAPKLPAKATLAAGAAPTAAVTEEKKLITDLLAAIPQDQLPPELQKRLGHFAREETHKQGRHMHRLVSEQDTAAQGPGNTAIGPGRLCGSMGDLRRTASGLVVPAGGGPHAGPHRLRRAGSRPSSQAGEYHQGPVRGSSGDGALRAQASRDHRGRHGRGRGCYDHYGCGDRERHPGQGPPSTGELEGPARANAGAAQGGSAGRREACGGMRSTSRGEQDAQAHRQGHRQQSQGHRRAGRRLQAAAAATFLGAPWWGPHWCLSGPCGPSRPARHSVEREHDFVGAPWAQILAINLQLEVCLSSCWGLVDFPFARDPRLEICNDPAEPSSVGVCWTEASVCHKGEDFALPPERHCAPMPLLSQVPRTAMHCHQHPFPFQARFQDTVQSSVYFRLLRGLSYACRVVPPSTTVPRHVRLFAGTDASRNMLIPSLRVRPETCTGAPQSCLLHACWTDAGSFKDGSLSNLGCPDDTALPRSFLANSQNHGDPCQGASLVPALSQPVQPTGASTAVVLQAGGPHHFLRRAGLPDGPFLPEGRTVPADPPSLLGRQGPARPSDISKLCLARVEVIPDYLARFPVSEIPLDQLGLFALEPGSPRRLLRYSVFDRQRHHVHRTASYGWSINDVVAEAVRSADEPIRAVQLITTHMPDLAVPQIVLTPADAAPTELCIPIDLRPHGGRPCTLLLRAGMHAHEVIREALQKCPRGPLPADLAQIQWLRIVGPQPDRPPEEETVFQHYPHGLLGYGPATTATTTLTIGHERVQLVSFVLAGLGITVRLHPQHIGLLNVASSVADLIMALARQRKLPPRSRVVIASAQPHPLQLQQVTIVFTLFPEDDRAHIILDPSADGSMVGSVTLDARARPEELVGDAQARQGYVAAINGVTQAAVRRNLCTGDYAQVVQHPRDHRVAPTDWFYQLLPDLRCFAFPIEVPRLHRATAEPLNTQVQVQVRDALLRYLRERLSQQADTMGRPAADRQPVFVQGPNHAPALLYVPGRTAPVLSEAEEAVLATGFFIEGTTLADTCELTHQHAPLFLSVPPGPTNFGLFLPTPTFYLGYHQAWLPPGTRPETLALPVRRGFHLVYPPVIQHGSTLRHRRTVPLTEEQHRQAATNAFRRGTSLATTHDPRPKAERRCKDYLQAHGLSATCDCSAGKIRCSPDPPVEAVTEVDSHSLLQRGTSIRSYSGGQVEQAVTRHSVPTPFGRRQIPRTRPAEEPTPVTTLSLASLCPVAPATQTTSGRCVRLQCGVTSDMFEHVFAPFRRGCLDPDWTAVPQLKSCSTRFIGALPEAKPAAPIEAIQFHVDGSFYANKSDQTAQAGWAICAVVLQERQWRWLGLLAVPCDCGGATGTLGSQIHSSFEPELAAIVYAMAFACAIPAPAMIAYDNSSAGQIAGGIAVAEQQTTLTQAAASLLHLLDLMHRRPAFLHTKSHQEQPLNEFADSAAKAAAAGRSYGTLPDTLQQASADAVLPWLWMALGIQPAVPRLCEAGVLTDSIPSSGGPSLKSLLPAGPLHGCATFVLRTASYNALTAASHAQRESLNSQFRARHLSLVGIQEARCTGATRQQARDYHIINSDACQGQCGCQVWLAKTEPVGRLDGQPIFWDSTGISVVFRAPRFLLLVAKAGGLKFGILCAHAPTGRAPSEERATWWAQLDRVFLMLPANCVPMLLIDANAQMSSRHLQPQSNSGFFQAFLQRHELFRTRPLDADGQPDHTWKSPDGLTACLDYVAAPVALHGTLRGQGVFHDFHGCVDHDHKPVWVEFSFRRQASLQERPPPLDYQHLSTPRGRQQLAKLLQEVPVV